MTPDETDLLEALCAQRNVRPGTRPSVRQAQLETLTDWSKERLFDAAEGLLSQGYILHAVGPMMNVDLSPQAMKLCNPGFQPADAVVQSINIHNYHNSPVNQVATGGAGTQTVTHNAVLRPQRKRKGWLGVNGWLEPKAWVQGVCASLIATALVAIVGVILSQTQRKRSHIGLVAAPAASAPSGLTTQHQIALGAALNQSAPVSSHVLKRHPLGHGGCEEVARCMKARKISTVDITNIASPSDPGPSSVRAQAVPATPPAQQVHGSCGNNIGTNYGIQSQSC